MNVGTKDDDNVRDVVPLLSVSSMERSLRYYVDGLEPQVGNALWDTRVTDPDGYRLCFASPTDTPEETKLSEVKV
jgi:hypothetical protein